MALNYMYRACHDGPMFDDPEDAWEWIRNNIAGGTVNVWEMVWCSDCSDWVEANGEKECPECGAKWYDEEGVCGFRGGIGKVAYAELKERRAKDREALAAWNAGKAINTGGIWIRSH